MRFVVYLAREPGGDRPPDLDVDPGRADALTSRSSIGRSPSAARGRDCAACSTPACSPMRCSRPSASSGCWRDLAPAGGVAGPPRHAPVGAPALAGGDRPVRPFLRRSLYPQSVRVARPGRAVFGGGQGGVVHDAVRGRLPVCLGPVRDLDPRSPMRARPMPRYSRSTCSLAGAIGLVLTGLAREILIFHRHRALRPWLSHGGIPGVRGGRERRLLRSRPQVFKSPSAPTWMGGIAVLSATLERGLELDPGPAVRGLRGCHRQLARAVRLGGARDAGRRSGSTRCRSISGG